MLSTLRGQKQFLSLCQNFCYRSHSILVSQLVSWAAHVVGKSVRLAKAEHCNLRIRMASSSLTIYRSQWLLMLSLHCVDLCLPPTDVVESMAIEQGHKFD